MEKTSSIKIEISRLRRIAIMSTLVLSTILASLDSSFVPIAFPDMIDDLDTSTAMVVWVALGYLIAATGPMLFLSRIGMAYGQVWMFQLGTIVYAFAMIACTWAPDINTLIILRCIQGLGMAMFLPCTFSLATQVYENRERGKALGIMQSANAFGFIAGPVFAGFLLDAYDWRAIFGARIPVAVFCIAVALIAFGKTFPKPPKPSKNTNFDLLGALYLTIGFFGLLFGFNRLPVEDNHLEPSAWIIFFSGVIFFWLFIQQERRTENPIIALDLFSNSIGFTKASIAFAAVFASFPVYLFVMPILLITGMEISTWDVGLILCSSALTTALISPYAGKMSDKIGAEPLCLIGTLLIAFSYLTMLGIDLETSIWFLLIPMIGLGLGTGFFFSPNNSLILSNVPAEQAAVASGMIGTLRQAGYAIGFAVIASMVTSVQDIYESSVSQFSLSHEALSESYEISTFFEDGGINSPEMLLTIFHMTVIACTAMLLIAIINSIPRFKPKILAVTASLLFCILSGALGIITFASLSDVKSYLSMDYTNTKRIWEPTEVSAFGKKSRIFNIPPRIPPQDALVAFTQNCEVCHGEGGIGIEGEGLNLKNSIFVSQRTDEELNLFLTQGRMENDKDNTTGLMMPPFDYISEDERLLTIQYMRTIQSP